MTDINEVTRERQVADLPQAQALVDAITKSLMAYKDLSA
jgi:hypothetical protein